MRKIQLLIISFSVLFNLAGQNNKYSTFYHQRATLFEKLPVYENDIIFLGNSITNGGEWAELFDDKRVKNRGISGDICIGVYDRLDAIVDGKPSKIFLLIGINDIARNTAADTIVAHTAMILDKIKLNSPQTKVYLQSILPVNDHFGMFEGHTKHWEMIKPLNEELKRLAECKEAVFIDLFSHFTICDSDKMDIRYTNDGLHLVGEGYLKWMEVIKPYFDE